MKKYILLLLFVLFSVHAYANCTGKKQADDAKYKYFVGRGYSENVAEATAKAEYDIDSQLNRLFGVIMDSQTDYYSDATTATGVSRSIERSIDSINIAGLERTGENVTSKKGIYTVNVCYRYSQQEYKKEKARLAKIKPTQRNNYGKFSEISGNTDCNGTPVEIITEPKGAYVTISDSHLTSGYTPIRFGNVCLGKHKLKIYKDNYEMIEEELIVPASNVIKKTLIRAKEEITIQTNLKNSNIYINGIDHGKEPVNFLAEMGITYKIKAANKEANSIATSITHSKGNDTTYKIEMKKKPATIDFRSFQQLNKDTYIYVNDISISKGIARNLNPDIEHEIRFEKEGYEDITDNLRLQGGEYKNYSATKLNFQEITSSNKGTWITLGLLGVGGGVALAASGGGGGGNGSNSNDVPQNIYGTESWEWKNDGNISLSNSSNANVYGMYNTNQGVDLYNNYFINEEVRNIDIINVGNGDIYGMYSVHGTYKIYNASGGKGAVNITNTGNGNVYGICGKTSYLANAYSSIGTIDITNSGSGNVYGMYGTSSTGSVSNVNTEGSGTINIINSGNGNIYGLYGNISQNAIGGKGLINIINTGEGNVYGMYGNSHAHNTGVGHIYSEGNINITNFGNARVYGMYGEKSVSNAHPDFWGNVGNINITNTGTEYVYGMYGEDVENYTNGHITLNNLANRGVVIGMLGKAGGTIENKGSITIKREAFIDDSGIIHTPLTSASEIAVGIYAKSGVQVLNSGTITISGYNKAYGIWAEDNTVTVTNTGTISIDGNTSHVNAIKLNGGTLFNDGIVSATNLNFDAFGGNVVATNTSKFNVKDDLSGTLNIADTSVQKGFDTTYQLTDVIQAGNTDNLKLVSQSALFNAELSDNKHDIVMTMKSFDDVTDNKSLASFLESNYANGNNEAFFNDIKSIGNATAFTSAMDSLTGRDTIAKFTHEDLTAMREVNFAMNELMFANNDKPMFETNGSLNAFNFKNDNNSSAQYALANKRISPRMKIGYAMSTTNLNTDNDDDTTRRNSVFQVFAPISYDRSGWQMIATPQIGFARGHYTRKGYNGTSYEGVIEKRIFALMNEARYPMTVGKFEIAPTVEFNSIAYNTKGSEDEKAYSLTMPSDNSLSVEAGLGIYAKRTIGNMKFNAGLMVYREFADPYNIKMGMNGMEGTFDLYDNRSEYRGVASFGFGYDVGKLNVYGNVQHFMETDTNTKFKAGLKFGF